ncbi:MAG: signal peptidase I, partial [Pseudomonadota bacterium]
MAEEAKTGSGVWETIKTIVYALLIAGIFRTLFFQPFWIPSGSMKQTLLIGDFLFVNKMTYGYSYASCPSLIIPSVGLNIDAEDICGWMQGDDNTRIWGGEPQRGDVIVFRHPVTGRDYIKRLIGLPGDRIQIRQGQIILNDTPVPQQPDGVFTEIAEPQGPQRLRPRCSNGPVGIGGVCEKNRLIETLPNGVSYDVLNIGNQGSDNTGIYTV